MSVCNLLSEVFKKKRERTALKDVKKLIQSTDSNGESALFKAVHAASFDAIVALINAGALASLKNQHGKTALDVASERGAERIVHYLKVFFDAFKNNYYFKKATNHA